MFKLPNKNAENEELKLPDKDDAENVMNKEELGIWSNTPPYLNLHNDRMASPTSESAPFSPFSNGFNLYGDAFQTLNHQRPESSPGKVGISDNKWDDDNDNVGLSKVFSGMSIFDDEQGNGDGVGGAKTRGFDITDSSYTYTLPASLEAHDPCCPEETGTPYPKRFSNEGNPPSTWGGSFGPPEESSLNLNPVRKQGSTPCYGPVQLQKPSFATSYPCDDFLPFGMDRDESWDVKSPFMFSEANSKLSQCLSPRRTGGDPVAFNCDNSFITQRKDVEYCFDNEGRGNPLRGCRKNSHNEAAIHVVGEKVPQLIPHIPGCLENNSTLPSDVPRPLLLDFYSLAEDQGHIYHLAKDQNGCRFLQMIIEEGNSEDMRVVFEGVIDNVVELMVHPFGNYLVQKLLHVCREDQRFHIVLMLTREPGQFVKTSLNTYGTRVVQKLIETLDSRKQLALVRSAVQSGFLDLTKDTNGNHVIQRCLQCFSCQDREFIFDAAAKFCVYVATHRHGCCVLKRCIASSVGKYQDKMVTEICKHGLLLAQDPFGNYVVQYIIELGIPSASNKLIYHFRGNYVYLSMQKFSSHVVEKCLKHVAESRSMIVRELLSVPHFEQLLQDPYANYVVQRALEVTKGSSHASLVEAICPHKILRASPYCKRIFSGSLLKK